MGKVPFNEMGVVQRSADRRSPPRDGSGSLEITQDSVKNAV